MKEKIKIKKAKKESLNFIKTLFIENNLPYEEIYSKIDNLFIAYTNSGKIGIGGIEIYGHYGLLRSLVVEKKFRGKGYGKELCLKIIEYA